MRGMPEQGRVVLSFGRFALVPGERLLTEEGAPVELGARTLDTLIALASRPHEVVGKRALMALVWPDVTVEEGSLRFHIASLRKALRDGQDGARYIATLAGRGYCFVAPVERSTDPSAALAPAPKTHFLPVRPTHMVGRSEPVGLLAAQLPASRFITIVGPGGVGKTTVAVAVAHDLLDAFDGAVVFVDLGVLNDPAMVAPTLASVLGLSVHSDDAAPGVIAYLRDKRILLVLDCCEHVIEGAARLAELIFTAAPKVHILATSREALRVEGEWVHRLAPLALPPDDARLTAAAALTYPAIRLFVDRAAASGARADFGDAEAAVVSNICRKLDGVALAIELAAGRVAAYGLEQTATLLDQRLALQWPGKRTAPARQKSLNATLDWSYDLLSEPERMVLRRLAVFVGPFTLEAAHAVTAIDAVQVLNAIESLVGKSMMATHPGGPGMRYRLLDTTRAYILGLAGHSGERAELALRHAVYYRHWLEQTTAEWLTLSNPAQRASNLADLNNVRAALAWCFGEDGHAATGIGLAAAAAPAFFAMSLLTDCQRWSQRAILALGDAAPEGRQEMRLQAALGLSLMWTRGNSEATYAALSRSIAIAEAQGDTLNQILLLAPLHVFYLRTGDFRTAQHYAARVADLARTTHDPAAIALSRILSGYSLHFAGDLDGARRALEAALRPDPGDAPSATLQDDPMAAPVLTLALSAAASAMARTLWLQGHPAEALRHVDQTVRDAASADHPVTLLVALIYAIDVLLRNGDLDDAEAQIARFIASAETYSLKSHVVLGRCFRGQLAISRGDHETGIEGLQASLAALHSLRYGLLTTAFNISLVQAYAATGRVRQGLVLIDETIRSVETNGDFCYLPELLRLKAGLLRGLPQPRDDEADLCLTESLALSRQQGARAWELRSSIDLARRLAAQAGPERARAELRPVFDQFVDGAQTADLTTAKNLLASWGQAAGQDSIVQKDVTASPHAAP